MGQKCLCRAEKNRYYNARSDRLIEYFIYPDPLDLDHFILCALELSYFDGNWWNK